MHPIVNQFLYTMMKPIPTCSHDLLVTIEEMAMAIVVTKNKDDSVKQNFRPMPGIPGRWLDGHWIGVPQKVLPNEGFAIHFVERDNLVFIGEYQGTQLEAGGRNSLILDNVQAFEITDFREVGESQGKLRAILKKNGAVTYSYYIPSHPTAPSSCYKIAEVKIRLQQSAFRRAVFGFHGSRCLITGCTAPALLDAAHLPGRRWDNGHNTAQDGIPLRVDLHRALDAALIKLNAQHQIVYLDPSLQDAYGRYMER